MYIIVLYEENYRFCKGQVTLIHSIASLLYRVLTLLCLLNFYELYSKNNEIEKE